MRNIIQFQISQVDGVYIASGVGIPVVTDGPTLEELNKNIAEAVELYFEGEDFSELGFGDAPSVLTSFEVPLNLHGAQA